MSAEPAQPQKDVEPGREHERPAPEGEHEKSKPEKAAANGQAGDAAIRRMAGGAIELPAAVRDKLIASFGALPAFEVIVDRGRVPDGARAASDGKRVFLRDAADVDDVKLIAHEVAHIIQFDKSRKSAGGKGDKAGAEGGVSEDGAVTAAKQQAAREGDDEKGEDRAKVEEIADKAAGDVEAGRKIADLATSPVVEGDTYLAGEVGRVAASAVRVVLFPGEINDGGTTRGHLYVYVNGKLIKTYDAVGGPPPGKGFADRGGHSAGETPAGEYTLGSQHHHTTQNWPMSVVPFGAKLRERADKDIEYSPDEGKSWLKATGLDGGVTKAGILFEERTRAGQAAEESKRTGKPVKPRPITDAERQQFSESYRGIFYDASGKLFPEYTGNDFGRWAFNLQATTAKGPAATPYYVHTTPDNEAETAEGAPVNLSQSHGCVHIKPAEREEMIRLGYLQKGVRFTVKPYGQKGP